MVKFYIEMSDAVKNSTILWQICQDSYKIHKMSALLSKGYIWPAPKVAIPGKAHIYEIIHL